jgi:hypothetical protein
VGDLQRGRVVAISAAMSGAFVALAGNETGFLPESAASAPRQPIRKAVQEGQILGLRVTRAAQAGKGPRLSALLADAEAALLAAAPPGAPRLVARGPCAAERLAARYPKAVLRVTGAGSVARLRVALGDRVQAQHGAVFDEAIEGEFAALAESAVALPGGGVLHIQTTRALTALDVDSGGAGDGRIGVAEQLDQGADVVAADHRGQKLHCHHWVHQGASSRALGHSREPVGLDVGRLVHSRRDALTKQVQQEVFLAGGRCAQ